MSQQLFRKWLREQMLQLVGVQRCSFGQTTGAGDPVREVDLTIHTWSGMVIYVHLIDELIKPNRVRRILESATASGIPSLFIVNAGLLPRHGERIEPDRWFVALQSLTADRLYAYLFAPEGPRIVPAQFRPAGRLVEAVYGQPIRIEQVRHGRIHIRQGPLKGYWLLADFEDVMSVGAPPIRRTDYSAYQFTLPPRRESSPPPPAQPSPREVSRLDQCYRLLGLKREASREDARAAFRRLAFEVHPDVSDLPKDEAEQRFKALSDAYDYIRAVNRWG